MAVMAWMAKRAARRLPVVRQGGRVVRLARRETEHLAAVSASSAAERILRASFAVAPIVAGVDKFTGRLVDWHKYLAPAIARRMPVDSHTFMKAVGVIEIAGGLLVALKPKWGGYIVSAWLGAIVTNLLASRDNYDIALRDVGLSLSALALGQVASRRDLS